MSERTIGRRTFLTGAAALGALAAVAPLAGCGSTDAGSTDTADTAEGTGSDAVDGEGTSSAASSDRIVVGRRIDSDNLDPVTCVGNQNIFMFNLVVEGLVKTSDDGKEIEPCLATDWEVSDDGLTYTFHVLEGLKFSDGSDVTAEDWQWTFDRAIATTDSHWYNCVANIDHVECPDDTTVIVVTKQAAASTLANLCIFEIGVQSKAYFDKVGEDEYVNGPIGTGAYMIDEWKKGEYITFKANPYYREEGLPVTPELEFKVVADDNSRTIQLQGGDIDIATDMAFSTMQQLESDSNVVVHPDPSTMVYWLSLNTQNENLADEKVRQALYLATDAQEVVDMVSYGYAETAGTIVSPSSEYCDTTLEPPTADVEAAKALLEEAGCADGFTLQLLIKSGDATFEQIGTILQSQWSKIGVTLELDQREATAYTAARQEMDMDLTISGWSDDVADPTSLMQFCFDYSVTFDYYTGYEQPADLVELNDEATVELDVEKRKELYAEIQQALHDQYIFIPLMSVPWQNCIRADIEGFVQTPLGNYRFEELARA